MALGGSRWSRLGETTRDPERLGSEYARATGKRLLPVDVFGLARWLDVSLVPVSGRPPWSGELDQSRGAPIIRYRTIDTIHHQRFTVAHELGHLLLRHHPRVVHRDTNRILPPWEEDLERAANNYAARLLMPTPYLLRYVGTYGVDVERIATAFKVSNQAMRFRLRGLGYPA